jgi:Protein of unknown function (DUF2490)
MKKIHHLLRSTKILILFLLLVILSPTTNGQTKKVSYTNQQWIQYYVQLKLSDKWMGLADAGYRSGNGSVHRSVYIARAGIGYQLNPNVGLGSGFAHLGFYRSGTLSLSENRLYQEVMVKHNPGTVGVSHRARLEERYFKYVDPPENNFNFRFRYRLLLSVPIIKLSSENSDDRKLLLNLGDEIFLNAGKEVVYNVFDQNRILIGMTVQLRNNLGINVTYNHQFIGLRSAGTYEQDEVLWLGINHTIDLVRN